MPNLATLIREAEKVRSQLWEERRSHPPAQTAPVSAGLWAMPPDPLPTTSLWDESPAALGPALTDPLPEREPEPSPSQPPPPSQAVNREPREIRLAASQLQELKEAICGFETEVMTAAQLARYLKVSKSYVIGRAHLGLIPGTKLAGRWRFKREIIDRWVEERIRNHQ